MQFSFVTFLFAMFLLSGTKESSLTGYSSEKSGILAFKAGPDFQDRVIPIHYFIPSGDPGRMTFQIVLHGASRNADDYLEGWKEKARVYGLVVIAPEFDAGQFSIGEYTEGGFMDSLKQINPQEKTLFSLVDRMFAFAKAELQLDQTKFNLFGHSAGGQFVHRYLQFYHSPHLHKSVAANPGWYTFPDETIVYPYGIKDLFDSASSLRASYYAKDMLLLLGGADTLRTDNLRVNAQADLQGRNRLERGKNFFAANSNMANTEKHPFHWKIAYVPDSGHQHELMSAAAADLLYGGSK